jgi:hypothetical protein
MKHNELTVIPVERIESKIFYIRGRKVMFDKDLAELYGVTTKRINEQVKRNKQGFSDEDFTFQLTEKEAEKFKSLIVQYGISNEEAGLMSQNVTLKTGRGSTKTFVRTFRLPITNIDEIFPGICNREGSKVNVWYGCRKEKTENICLCR